MAALGAGCWTSGGDEADATHDRALPDDAAVDDDVIVEDEASLGREDGGTEDVAEADRGSCCTELGGPCNVVTQCGCPDGEKCALRMEEGVPPIEECVPAGSGRHLAPCTPGEDDCAPGAQCFELWAGEASCLAFCYSDFDCSESHPCELSLTGVDGYLVCTDAYASACDLFTGTGCRSGDACTVTVRPLPDRLCAPPAWHTGLMCGPAGETPPGGDCTTEPCVLGAGCHELAHGRPTCYRYCHLGDWSRDCEDLPGTSCEATLLVSLIGTCIPW